MRASCFVPRRSAVAESIADRLVTEAGCACVSVLPGLVSIYSWKGSRCRDHRMSAGAIKTTAAAYPALEQTIRQIHPYEVPEILRLPVVGGWSAYLVGSTGRWRHRLVIRNFHPDDPVFPCLGRVHPPAVGRTMA